jgi:light-regulated signal transduction histidine kinase (bacteriophytochrome)
MSTTTKGPGVTDDTEDRIKRFLATASHDLQSPLRHIAMYAEILLDDLEDKIDAEQRQSLTAILDKAQAAQKLTKALMTVASGSPQVAPAMADLGAIVDEAWNEAKAETAVDEALLRHDALPPLRTDPVLAATVLKHVLVNSLVHRGREKPGIDILARRDGEEWLIEIADNGAGIDPAYQDRIFDPFWKLPKPGSASGPGLGLTTARELLAALGGTITLMHSDEAGSRFAIRLPAG